LRTAYEPLYNYFCCLFPTSGDSRNVVSELNIVLKGINDAPLVFDEIKQRIEEKLVNEPFVALPFAAKVNLTSDSRDETLPSGEVKCSPKPNRGATLTAPTTHRGDLDSPGNGEKRKDLEKGAFNMLLLKDGGGRYHREFLREDSAFKRQLPELIKRYHGRFVAISGEKVVDNDSDVEELRKRIRKDYRNKAVLIKSVSAEADRVVEIDTMGI